jgi:UDP-N-acetylglucosamine 2-epimerase (non-hydrolysing)/GDP/UDP-N,N'-diacetylbacillosamine 2-epimerase (hydrolysing)
MRTIGVVTVGRSDFGILRPVLRAIQADDRLQLQLLVAGSHLSGHFGHTVDEIRGDGFPIAQMIDVRPSTDSPAAIAEAIGANTMAFAKTYAQTPLDILLVLGDRYEMHAAALAAVPLKIPIAHIHGGEVTHGAIDDALRHAMTKYSHLHFASAQVYADRIIQLGEEPWRVHVSGAPALDNLRGIQLLALSSLEQQLGMALSPAPLIVTYHPVTLQYEQTEHQIAELLAALDDQRVPIVFTLPNADTRNRVISSEIERFVSRHPPARLVKNLGTQTYFSLMNIAAAMVGNSSSGIIEAASFRLPVVNVGLRQAGRHRPPNVIDVPADGTQIRDAIDLALGDSFRDGLTDLTNPYDQGGASRIIVDCLRNIDLDEKLIVKKFYDLPLERVC